MAAVLGPERTTGAARWVCGAAVLAAGALHVPAAAQHVAGSWWVAVFLGLVAVAQVGTGALVVQGTGPRWLTTAVLAGATALVCLFLVVHGTTWLDVLAGHRDAVAVADHAGHAAVPTGPVSMGGSGPEPADALGLATVALEALAVAAGTLLLPPARRQLAADGLLGLAVAVVALWVTGVLS